ncbi:MAG TPA: hypothetical protein VF669_18840 [Tepidisphaeraceae bacterium]|jgi:tetratricopeptide (TPR) repeat protein
MGATTQPALPEFIKLWNFSDPAATEKKFREVLPQFQTSGNENARAELLTQIARAQGLQHHFQEAHATLDRVEKMLKPGTARPRVRYLLERGRVFNSSGQPDKALPLFKEAITVAEQANELRLQIDAIHMVAIAEKDPHEQLKWNLRALEIVDKHPDEEGWLPALYNNTGETYLLLKDYPRALDMFEKLAALDAEDVYARKDVGKCLRLMGKLDQSEEVLRPVDGKGNGWVSAELAETLLAQGKPDQAKTKAKEAHDLLSKDEHPDPNQLQRLKQIMNP